MDDKQKAEVEGLRKEVDELFRQKGELLTQLEIAQQKLQAVNQKLSQLLMVNPVVQIQRTSNVPNMPS